MALVKAQHDEELKKIQILEKQRVVEENYKETQEKHAQAQQIKYEIEALKRKDRLESVARIRRKEEFTIAAQRRRMNEIHGKISEFEQHKVQEYLDKLRYKQEMHLQDELLQAAVETFRKTKKWNPPIGLNFEIDMHAIKQQVFVKIVQLSPFKVDFVNPLNFLLFYSRLGKGTDMIFQENTRILNHLQEMHLQP